MLNLILYTLMAACVANAGPTRRAEDSSPPISTANAFTLVANVTGDQSNVFHPPIGTSSLALGSRRLGANVRVGTLENGTGYVFFANGTDSEISSQKGSIGLPPQPLTNHKDGTVYYMPVGMTFEANSVNASIQMNINPGTKGAGIVSGQGSPWAQLFTPFGQGPFHVCNVTEEFDGQMFRVFIPIGDAAKIVPDNCVRIRLLPQCAVLPDLPGAKDVNIMVKPVQCYQNVSAIDWKLYSS